MQIRRIRLINYRSFENLSLEFENKLNYICGPNAVGKTNLIEGIYYLSLGRSFKKNKDRDLIKESAEIAQILIEYESSKDTHTLRADITKKGKVIYFDEEKQKSVTSIVGKLHCIVYTPSSVLLFQNEPSERRKIIDSTLSSLSKKYLYALVRHRKILKERNMALLKGYDENVIEVLTDELINVSFIIYDQRKKFVDEVNKHIQEIYCELFGESQKIALEYITNVPDISSQEEFKSNLKKLHETIKTEERIRKTTLIGVQRDDLKAYIDSQPVFAYASQGQNRLLVLALKIAIARIVKQKIGEDPILLLDDVLSDLDEERKNNLVEYLKNSGQVFITSTEEKKKTSNCDIYQIEKNG